MRSPRSVLKLVLAATLLVVPASARAERAHHLVAAIAQHAAFVQVELRIARADGHRDRVRCLSGKLSEIHAQERLANERERLLAAAIERRDEHDAARSRAILVMLRERARELSRQAQRCGRFGSMPSEGYRVRVIAAR